MRPPHYPLLERPCLTVGTPKSLVDALGSKCSDAEEQEIYRLCELDLPPVTSTNALSVLAGFNPGFTWSLVNRTSEYYRRFSLPKGRSQRTIEAPKVALKLIQKWLANHFGRVWLPIDAVHGFVEGRSHITAASVHLGANWLASIDIKDFFPSTSHEEISSSLLKLGYRQTDSLRILSKICSLWGKLPQGAPTSPVLSNIALDRVDKAISKLASHLNCQFTRYADDIVLSGYDRIPDQLLQELRSIFQHSPWQLAEEKTYISESPQRLKVHGLLVHGDYLRLTKKYRNRIRAYKHLLHHKRIQKNDLHRVRGHVQYAEQVDNFQRSMERPQKDF